MVHLGRDSRLRPSSPRPSHYDSGASLVVADQLSTFKPDAVFVAAVAGEIRGAEQERRRAYSTRPASLAPRIAAKLEVACPSCGCPGEAQTPGHPETTGRLLYVIARARYGTVEHTAAGVRVILLPWAA